MVASMLITCSHSIRDVDSHTYSRKEGGLYSDDAVLVLHAHVCVRLCTCVHDKHGIHATKQTSDYQLHTLRSRRPMQAHSRQYQSQPTGC